LGVKVAGREVRSHSDRCCGVKNCEGVGVQCHKGW
jgi:hypothetical protein